MVVTCENIQESNGNSREGHVNLTMLQQQSAEMQQIRSPEPTPNSNYPSTAVGDPGSR